MPLSASAEEMSEEMNDFLQSTEEAIEGSTPEEVKDKLIEKEVSLSNPESLNNISFEDMLEYFMCAISDELGSPLKLLARLVGIMLICTLVYSISDSNNRVIETVGTLSAVAVTYSSISSVVDRISQSLSDLSTFMLTYVPAFVGVLSSSGAVGTATSYYTALLLLCEGVTILTSWLIPTVCGFILAIAVSQGVSVYKTSTPSSELRKIINRAMALVATIFVGVLSIKTFVSASADSVLARSAKFAASSFVPVIGSAVSEAYSTVTGSLSLIRSAIGGIGMLVVLFTVLKPIVAVVIMSFALKLACAIAKMLSLKSQACFLEGVGDVLSVLLTASIIIAMLFIVATAVMMVACMGI